MAPPPNDAEHLKMLSICHYVMAGISILTAFFPAIYLAMGTMFLSAKFPPVTPAGPAGPGVPAHVSSTFPVTEMGWMMIILGSIGVTILLSGTILTVLSARWISARKNLTFCLIVAGIECIHTPLGTILGVFTFVVLLRPSVKALFEAKKQGLTI